MATRRRSERGSSGSSAGRDSTGRLPTLEESVARHTRVLELVQEIRRRRAARGTSGRPRSTPPTR